MGDFRYFKGYMTTMLTDRNKMIEEQKMYKQYQDLMPVPDRRAAKEEMGAWIADYFDDAGYVNWENQTQMYKAMLLTAFPPIDDLDNEKPDYATMPIDLWEELLTKFLAVMD